jgi:hypothetical protein
MDINQIIHDLTYWFDFSIHMVRNHPLVSVTAVLIAFISHYALSAMKLTIGIISLGLAMVAAVLLERLMF